MGNPRGARMAGNEGQQGGRVGCDGGSGGGGREFASGSEWRSMVGNGNAIHAAGPASRAVAQPAPGNGVGRRGELRIESKAAVNGVPVGAAWILEECAALHMGMHSERARNDDVEAREAEMHKRPVSGSNVAQLPRCLRCCTSS
jgi:hypothetical protein